MSFALALRNSEGVLLATDSSASRYDAWGRRQDVESNKIRWIRGLRAACALFPVHVPSELLADEPGEVEMTADLRASVSAVYAENIPAHARYIGQLGGVHQDWYSPQLLVAAYPPSGPALLRITEGELEGDLVGDISFFLLGAWNEIGPFEPRLSAVPWRRCADSLAEAATLLREVMLEYIADYELAGPGVHASWGPTIGGPVNIVTITQTEVRES